MEESMKAALSDNMAKILQEEGPIVQMVILKPAGTVVEETFDSTPSKNHLSELMGGPVTILGKYHQLNVVLLKLRSPQQNTAVNTNVLHPPFANAQVIGPIGMVRMNKEALPEDFTKIEFENFMNLSSEEFEKREQEAIEKEEEDADADEVLPQEPIDPELLKEMTDAFEAAEDEDDENEEEEEGEENVMAAPAALLDGVQDFKSQLLNQVVSFYQEQHGRDPTEEETLDAMKEVLREMARGAGQVEEENEEENENEEEEEKETKPEETPSKVTRKRPAEDVSEADSPLKKKIKLSDAPAAAEF
jgi:hypothetical protein